MEILGAGEMILSQLCDNNLQYYEDNSIIISNKTNYINIKCKCCKFDIDVFNKDKNTFPTLRLIISAIKDVKIAKKVKEGDLKDEDIVLILRKMVKQRNDSCDAYKKANREDLFNSEQKELLVKASKHIPLLLAPNMSIGVNATLRSISELSKILSKYEVSIEETHHKNKLDSPSGTALKIAEVIVKSRQSNLSDIKIESFREEGEVGIH